MKWSKNLKSSKLMWKLLRFYLVIMAIMLFIFIYTMHFLTSLQTETANTFAEMGTLQNINATINKMTVSAKSYYETEDETYSLAFTNDYQSAVALAAQLSANHPDQYIYRDIEMMINSFYQDGMSLFEKLNNRVNEKIYYRDKLLSLDRLKISIQEITYSAISDKLVAAQNRSQVTSYIIQRDIPYIYAAIAGVTMLCIFFAIRFSKKTADPIHNLSQKLQQVAQGNLSVREKEISRNDDVNILIYTFNFMVDQLEKSMNEIKLKAEIESQLREEQLANAEMRNLLQKSELEFLHMQINPHFLFNTFNSISALALMENAEKTQSMLDCLSCLLRYNLSSLNNEVPLRDEIQILGSYLYIQETRFGQRIQHTMIIPESVLDYKIPSMILQPIIENSIVHGLEPTEKGGLIQIEAHLLIDQIQIVVADNGIGMTANKVATIMNPTTNGTDFKGSIGLSNVKRRLEMIYGCNIMYIRSQPGQGTVVELNIPILK